MTVSSPFWRRSRETTLTQSVRSIPDEDVTSPLSKVPTDTVDKWTKKSRDSSTKMGNEILRVRSRDGWPKDNSGLLHSSFLLWSSVLLYFSWRKDNKVVQGQSQWARPRHPDRSRTLMSVEESVRVWSEPSDPGRRVVFGLMGDLPRT